MKTRLLFLAQITVLGLTPQLNAASAPDAPKFLNEPFASKLAPSTLNNAARAVATHYLAMDAAAQPEGVRAIWKAGLEAAAQMTGDTTFAKAAGKITADPSAVALLGEGADPARAKAVSLWLARKELEPLTEAQRWHAPGFKVLTEMSNRKIGFDPDPANAGLGLAAVFWGNRTPLGIMIIDYIRVPALSGWMKLLDRVETDGAIRDAGPQPLLSAGAFLLAAREALALSGQMSQPQAYTATPEYKADLEFQKKRLADAPIPNASDSLTVLRKATAWQMQNLNTKSGAVPDAFWLRGTFAAGVIAMYQATGDNYYLRVARDLAQRVNFTPGPMAGEVHGADDLGISQLFLALSEIEKNPKYMEPTRAALDSVLGKTKPGAFEWYWVDALFMAPPVWVHMTKLTGEKKYLDHANTLFWETADKLWDPESNLIYRDRTYIPQPDGMQLCETDGEKVFWGRGNGWFTGALALVLNHLPEDHPSRPKYEARLREQLAALAKLQQPTGLWPTALLNQDGYPMGDTSATALFAYGYAWAIRHGLIDRATYLPVLLKAWAALVASVEPNGRLGFAQSQADSTRAYVGWRQSEEYATGAMLLAGSEILPLLRERDAATATPQAKTIDPDAPDRLLPPKALTGKPLAPGDHAFAEAINRFLAEQPGIRIEPTGITKADYLAFVRRHVEVFGKHQRADGAVTDAFVEGRMDYITPAYAVCVAGLAALDGERDPALLESGFRAMDFATAALAKGRSAFPHSHSEFWPFPVMIAFELFQGIAPAERLTAWRKNLEAINPDTTYFLPRSSFNNWTLKGAAGELLRAKAGMTSLDYTDTCLEFQRHFFTAAGMFNENKAFAYDAFPRYVLTSMLHKGYRSAQFEFYRDMLWRGAWSELFLQSPNGEGPTGGRSTQHIWNETQITAMSEIMATHYAKAGRPAEAGAFKRAARLAFQASLRWRFPDGTATMVKNFYPPEKRHGYEAYSYISNYDLYACAMLVTAAMAADDSVAEKPAPTDVGGYVLEVPGFDMVVANGGGTFIQYATRFDGGYGPAGLVRVQFRGVHGAIPLNDGISNRGLPGANDWETGFKNSEAPRDPERDKKLVPAFLSLGPAWTNAQGRETRLAAFGHGGWFGPGSGERTALLPLEQTPARVKFRLESRLPNGSVAETFTLDADGLHADVAVKTPDAVSRRLYMPVLLENGRAEVQRTLEPGRLTLRLPEGAATLEIQTPQGLTFETLPDRFVNRNGFLQAAYVEFPGESLTFTLRPLR